MMLTISEREALRRAKDMIDEADEEMREFILGSLDAILERDSAEANAVYVW